ncbi:hypothetical protein BQ8482_330171 [Mesorhizobium delmotii]|uniref:Uncharacterized protein n=1 Tax=Mesorhizobium delmotii TaxID=1631247 RepID=A0A2P9API0_9HYPH|nr:hypothetical protein BQ8482_330171 [Mesorhizobium delmotii]
MRRWIKKSAGTINKPDPLSLKKPASAETALLPCGDSAAIPWLTTHDIVAIPGGAIAGIGRIARAHKGLNG